MNLGRNLRGGNKLLHGFGPEVLMPPIALIRNGRINRFLLCFVSQLKWLHTHTHTKPFFPPPLNIIGIIGVLTALQSSPQSVY